MTKPRISDYTVAYLLYLVVLVVVFVAFLVSVSTNRISDKAAECASLGGVYSNESDSCYYAGKQSTASDIRKDIGL